MITKVVFILRLASSVSLVQGWMSSRPSRVQRAAKTLLKVVAEPSSIVSTTKKFDWFQKWYPIAPVDYLDEEIPHQFMLFNEPIVVWKDGAVPGASVSSRKQDRKQPRQGGEWRAFRDECPHRKVPLSEGRVEDDGNLLCSYHGYRFDGNGTLVDLPQAPDQLEQIQKSPKSTCNSFPTQVIDGVLWVWPQTGNDARLQSLLTPAKSYNMTKVDVSRVWKGPWNFRELPYSSDYFIENVVDGAHVAVSHHNVVGNRYGDLEMKTTMETVADDKSSFVMRNKLQGSAAGTDGGSTTFQAPTSVFIETGVGDQGAKQVLELYATPSRPGFCWHTGRLVVVKDEDGSMPKFLRLFTLPMPTWLNHVLAASFLNQDALFLHAQERQLAASGAYSSLDDDAGKDFAKTTMLADSDLGVSQFRSWLREAGGVVPYRNQPAMPPVDKAVVFDQWNSHTKHCQYCLGALKNLKRLRGALFMLATTLGVLRPLGRVGSLASVLATTGLGVLTHKLIGRFYKYEYSHAHND